MANHAWLIEAPGQRYLATREIGHHPHFYWSTDHMAAIRFYTDTQADGVMMALRRMDADQTRLADAAIDRIWEEK